MSQFADSIGRSGNEPEDKEMAAMRSELNMYYKMEQKEDMEKSLQAMRAKHFKDLDEEEKKQAVHLQEMVDETGFVIDDRRTRK